HRAEYVDRLLDLLEGSVAFFENKTPGTVDEFVSYPSIRAIGGEMRRCATREQKKRYRLLKAQMTKGDVGRPKQAVDQRRDVLIAIAVEDARQRLERGFTVVQRQRDAHDFSSDDDALGTLLGEQFGYDGVEIHAMLTARDLAGAANRLVAARTNDPVKSVA